jgi:hypothetical protein
MNELAYQPRTWLKVVAPLLCAAALAVFFLFAPTAVRSQGQGTEGCGCWLGGLNYPVGSCAPSGYGVRCLANDHNNGCAWYDDLNCGP